MPNALRHSLCSYRPSIHTNHAGAKANDADDLQATAHASGIQTVQDDPETTVLRLEMTPDKVEWVLFSPARREVEFAGQTTRKAYEYRR